MTKTARVLVTGGAGFIGSHVVEELVSQGYAVRVLDSLVAGDLRHLSNVSEKIEFVEGDVRDSGTLREVMQGVAAVFHLAALIAVVDSQERPEEYEEVNVKGTRNILMAARAARVSKIIFSSSCSVHELLSPYAETKKRGEEILLEAHEDVDVFTLRYFNVYGPRQRADSDYAAVVPKFKKALDEEARPVMYGDGEQTRDFIHVSDVARANVACLRDEAKPGVYDIGSGKETSIQELLKVMGKSRGFQLEPEMRSARAGEIRHSCASVTEARDGLGWQAELSLSDGLKTL